MRHDIKTSEFERGKICKLTPFQNKVSLNSFKLVIGDLWYYGLIFEFAACPNRAVALCRPNNKPEKHKTSVNWWTGWKILGVRTGKPPGIGGRNRQKKIVHAPNGAGFFVGAAKSDLYSHLCRVWLWVTHPNVIELIFYV
jgi:hypothetical protein